MELPKNLTGAELIKKLGMYGYEITRQKGSHIRIKTVENGVHSETIPNHNPLKIGTLSKILKNIAEHLNISKDELIQELFK